MSIRLSQEMYTAKNVLFYGVCKEHWKKAGQKGALGTRIVHSLVGLLETIPLLGQITALFEAIIAKIAFKKNHRRNRSVIEEKHVDPAILMKQAAALEKGLGVAKDENKAIILYMQAATKGAHEAYLCAANLHEKQAKDQVQELLKFLKKGAEEGNAEAQYQLAKCYEKGKGVTKNFGEAFDWYMKASVQDHAEANYKVGKLKARACGQEDKSKMAPSDYTRKARKLGSAKAIIQMEADHRKPKELARLEVAASLQNPKALFLLGIYSITGTIYSQNTEKGVRLLKKAYESGMIEACIPLHHCYLYGVGVEANKEEAQTWLMRGVKHGNPDSLKLSKLLTKNPDLTKVAAGDGQALFKLKEAYVNEKEIPLESYLTLIILFAAAEAGSLEAQLQMGEEYYNSKLYETSRKYYTLAAKQKNQKAIDQLAKIDIELKKDPQPQKVLPNVLCQKPTPLLQPHELIVQSQLLSEKLAGECLRQAAEKGMTEAERRWGEHLEKGIGVEKDLIAAAIWYQKAADKKDPLAIYHLVRIHLEGIGVKKNLALAYDFFIQAEAMAPVPHDFPLKSFMKKMEKIKREDFEDFTLKVLKKASADGHPEAERRVGEMILDGAHGFLLNIEEGVALLKSAAAKGNDEACLTLHRLYQRGRKDQITPDENLSRMYLKQAAELGNWLASGILLDIRNREYFFELLKQRQ